MLRLRLFRTGENRKSIRDRPRSLKNGASAERLLRCGTPEGTRTPNPQNRNLMRYPLRYGRIEKHACHVQMYYNNLSQFCKGALFNFFVGFQKNLKKSIDTGA